MLRVPVTQSIHLLHFVFLARTKELSSPTTRGATGQYCSRNFWKHVELLDVTNYNHFAPPEDISWLRQWSRVWSVLQCKNTCSAGLITLFEKNKQTKHNSIEVDNARI